MSKKRASAESDVDRLMKLDAAVYGGGELADDFYDDLDDHSGVYQENETLKNRVKELEAQVNAQGGAIVLNEKQEFVVGNFRFTPTGLIPLVENVTEVELKAVGIVLFRLFDSLQFMIGDWLEDAGAYDWGVLELLAKAFRKKIKTLINWQSVAANVPYHVRRSELDYSHHAEVSPLPHDEQIRWLALAVDNGWSARELRARIADAKKIGDGTNKKTGRPAKSPAAIHRPYRQSFKSIWADLMAGVSPKKEEIRKLKKWLNELEKDENS